MEPIDKKTAQDSNDELVRQTMLAATGALDSTPADAFDNPFIIYVEVTRHGGAFAWSDDEKPAPAETVEAVREAVDDITRLSYCARAARAWADPSSDLQVPANRFRFVVTAIRSEAGHMVLSTSLLDTSRDNGGPIKAHLESIVGRSPFEVSVLRIGTTVVACFDNGVVLVLKDVSPADGGAQGLADGFKVLSLAPGYRLTLAAAGGSDVTTHTATADTAHFAEAAVQKAKNLAAA